MCGIAGLLNFRNTRGDHSPMKTVGDMIYELAHRGPDRSGTWANSDHSVVFGHRRLSVQDLSEHGNQPMISASGRYVITFNGEIYNFKELRTELIAAGQQFRGGSDTEVILAAIETWGMQEMLQKISGMFAFGIWDHQTNTLTLARDRLGEKPLYWGILNERLVFASELKAFRKVPVWQCAVDPDMLAAYFRYGYVPAPYSILRSVYKLPAGNQLTVPLNALRAHKPPESTEDLRASNFEPQPFWSLADELEAGREHMIADSAQALSGLKSCISDAVRRQQIADVPVGAFLSGGIDSSLVVAIAQELRHQPLKTFTISFPNSSHDESYFAAQVAEHLGTEHHTLPLTPQDLLDTVPLLPKISDEPFGNPSQIPVYLLSKFAREQVTVCLAGDGGDELFGGYNRYMRANQLWDFRKRMPAWSSKTIATILSAIPYGATDALSDKIHDWFPKQRVIPPALGLKLQKLTTSLRKSSLSELYLFLRSFYDQPLQLVPNAKRDLNIFEHLRTPECHLEFIERAMYIDTLTYLPDDGLAKVDRAAMAVGLETRLPLLDRDVLSYAWRLALPIKIRNKQTKWCLKQLLRSYLPAELIDRPKMGFTVPISEWLRGPLRDWAHDILMKDVEFHHDLLDPQVLNGIWNEHQNKTRDHGLILWAVINFLTWHKHFESE